MAPRAAWWALVVLSLIGTASVCFAAEEVASDVAEASSGVTGEGGKKFPAQEMKEKSADIERSYLAHQKVKMEYNEEKWQKKVQKIQVGRVSDHVMEQKAKYLNLQNIRTNEVLNKDAVTQKAVNEVRGNQESVNKDMVNKGRIMESTSKASISLKVAIKKTEALKNGEGINALGDRQSASAMLAKLRIAQAHADGSIKGLTKAQREQTPDLMLHSSVENMVGKQTEQSIMLAKHALKDAAKAAKERHWKGIDALKAEYVKRVATEKEEKTEMDQKLKLTKETAEKKNAEKAGKKIENVNDQLEKPGKKIKEGWGKKEMSLIRANWMAHEQRITDEKAVKGTLQTARIKETEKSEKAQVAEEAVFMKESCGSLNTKKTEALEIRTKKIDAYGMAREHVVVTQEMLDAAGGASRRLLQAPQVEVLEGTNKGEVGEEAGVKMTAGADEATLKTALKQKEDAAATAQTEMKEANEKAAEADTDYRKCGGAMMRRRRTCACDDPPGGAPSDEIELGETDDSSEEELPVYERRRYVRRRYKEPTGRRRRYSGPGAGSTAARMPGVVCPCCPPGQKPKTTACMVADAQAKAKEMQDSVNRL